MNVIGTKTPSTKDEKAIEIDKDKLVIEIEDTGVGITMCIQVGKITVIDDYRLVISSK